MDFPDWYCISQVWKTNKMFNLYLNLYTCIFTLTWEHYFIRSPITDHDHNHTYIFIHAFTHNSHDIYTKNPISCSKQCRRRRISSSKNTNFHLFFDSFTLSRSPSGYWSWFIDENTEIVGGWIMYIFTFILHHRISFPFVVYLFQINDRHLFILLRIIRK